MPETPKVAAVVLNWNQSQMTIDCVKSLRQQTRPVDVIIVVDNGSKQPQRAILNELADDCVRVLLNNNLGFAGGMNVGIQEALRQGAQYIWLVNNDAFPDVSCLKRLIEKLEQNDRLAAVTPKIVGVDGVEQFSGGYFDVDTDSCYTLLSHELTEPQSKGRWLIGTLPLFTAESLSKVQGFDSRLFAYCEEIELFLRLARLDYTFCSVPTANAVHIGSVSTGGSGSPFSQYMHSRNRLHVCRWHHNRKGSGLSFATILRTDLTRASQYYEQGDTRRAQILIQAAFAAVLREYGPPRLLKRTSGLAKFVASRLGMLLNSYDRCIQMLRSIRTGVRK